ncbi:beta-ketoacyl-ACP synthase [Xanthobacteraceae bacterium Astr-EGSB]|uniref:beta-ketoacyl-ACP synthase n=1 Tax=Astrobacterium formosum TaxID=3069710 RepID=UPI0027AFA8A8|nr:beta-ketoacyl-ACP synthase [Xanthobacteraceae bacterium Astr-EGSB]
MTDAKREAWITGIGIVSSLGEGPEAHWQALSDGKPVYDATTFAPCIVHPLAHVDFDKQIPKKGDQRQMEQWQRIGTYAAGLALDSAKVKGDKDILARTHMIVAAGGGERDSAVDCAILDGLPKAPDHDLFLNERLMGDLRPTLFLAQLSNLLAGNISIVHGVVGSSRTFMGEEAAGIDATRIALARINAGQSDIALVGAAHNGERRDQLMLYECGHYNLKNDYRPVWDREPGGFAIASMGAFLVLESREHAEKRGATPIAKLAAVASDRCARRQPGEIKASLEKLWGKVGSAVSPATGAIISGACGAEPGTSEEKAFLAAHADFPARATGSLIGHGFEPQFIINIAFAALAVQHGRLFAPCAGAAIEKASDGVLDKTLVTGVGHWRGEGLALVEAVR